MVSPAYVAVRLLAPAEVKVTSHCPADTAAMHWLVPSLTVTLPVSGAPSVPGAATATVQVTVTGWPTTEGSGLSELIVVVVLALPTVTVLAAGELLVSLLSAMRLFGSICAIPPPVRGFWYVPTACAVALKTTSKLLAPMSEAKVTLPPFATQVKSLLTIEQLMFALPVMFEAFCTVGVP